MLQWLGWLLTISLPPLRGEDVDGAGQRAGSCVGRVGEGLPEEDALRAGPFGGEAGGGFEDGWGVGEEAAVPEVGAAAFEDVDGLGRDGAASALGRWR